MGWLRHVIKSIDSDVSGQLHRATARGRVTRRMTGTAWSGSYIASMPPWWVGKRARVIKTRRKRR
jgi:hypothetical protein